jgi:uncharacterized protein (TIGR03083 family)
VRALLNHVLGAGRMFTLANAGHQVGPDAGDLLGADPAAAIPHGATDNVEAWRRPGALDGDRTYPFGTFPAPAALLLNVTEVVMHGWDLANATGQDRPSTRASPPPSTNSGRPSRSTRSGPRVRSARRSMLMRLPRWPTVCSAISAASRESAPLPHQESE